MPRSVGIMSAVLLFLGMLIPLTTVASEGNRACMSCHAKPDLVKRLNHGETVTLRVDYQAYLGSAHGELSCQDCHTEYSSKSHPIGSYANKEELARRHSKSCVSCHPLEQLTALPVHKVRLLVRAAMEPTIFEKWLAAEPG